MLKESKELPELFYMKHRHDDNKDYIDYSNVLFDRNLSPYIFKNDMMNSFLKRTQVLLSLLFDQMNVMKNFKNFTVDKYEYNHKN